MSANHSRDPLDAIEALSRKVADLQAALALGAQAAKCTSTTRPANPAVGRLIVETDTGLRAWWNGSMWVYDPQLIKKQVVGSPTSFVTFSVIPQVFTNLQLRICAQSDGTGASGYDAALAQFNGVTSNYNWNSIFTTQGGTPATAGSTAQSSMQCAEIWNAHFASAGRGIATIDIPNYADGTGTKGFTGRSSASDGGSAGILQTYDGWSKATTAITSINILMGTGNFVAGSEFSLYGS